MTSTVLYVMPDRPLAQTFQGLGRPGTPQRVRLLSEENGNARQFIR
ncbi:hypothetical protein [Brucella sp. IR073]